MFFRQQKKLNRLHFSIGRYNRIKDQNQFKSDHRSFYSNSQYIHPAHNLPKPNYRKFKNNIRNQKMFNKKIGFNHQTRDIK